MDKLADLLKVPVGSRLVYTDMEGGLWKPITLIQYTEDPLRVYNSLNTLIDNSKTKLRLELASYIQVNHIETIAYLTPDDDIIWRWDTQNGMTHEWESKEVTLVTDNASQQVQQDMPTTRNGIYATTGEGEQWLFLYEILLPTDIDWLQSNKTLPPAWRVLSTPGIHSLALIQEGHISWHWDVINGWNNVVYVRHTPTAVTEGVKNDSGKKDYTLLPWGALDEVVAVLAYGAEKYDRDNWQKIHKFRYGKALLRHVVAYCKGETLDPESGLHHLAHATCCCLFIIHQDTKQQTANRR